MNSLREIVFSLLLCASIVSPALSIDQLTPISLIKYSITTNELLEIINKGLTQQFPHMDKDMITKYAKELETLCTKELKILDEEMKSILDKHLEKMVKISDEFFKNIELKNSGNI